jgi:hypothetical protein
LVVWRDLASPCLATRRSGQIGGQVERCLAKKGVADEHEHVLDQIDAQVTPRNGDELAFLLRAGKLDHGVCDSIGSDVDPEIGDRSKAAALAVDNRVTDQFLQRMETGVVVAPELG